MCPGAEDVQADLHLRDRATRVNIAFRAALVNETSLISRGRLSRWPQWEDRGATV